MIIFVSTNKDLPINPIRFSITGDEYSPKAGCFHNKSRFSFA